jgi:hypothetical protein
VDLLVGAQGPVLQGFHTVVGISEARKGYGKPFPQFLQTCAQKAEEVFAPLLVVREGHAEAVDGFLVAGSWFLVEAE